MNPFPNWTRRLAALALLAVVLPAFAAPEDELLPVDEAYVLSATAPTRDRIELDWKIAEDYYLYRHRTSVQVQDGGFAAQPLQMPDGIPYTDEFFGDVETYRGRLVAVLPGRVDDGATTVTLQVKYQGCADIGI
ncbi:MAG TPA: protein-disulfide reductase DsbD N-terminal domain-containing protein, partial [Luteimonas sp.]|nr:protein-disulfide reductase DsbD N-terminal domain-containing protein [Luteimonas sp.]